MFDGCNKTELPYSPSVGLCQSYCSNGLPTKLRSTQIQPLVENSIRYFGSCRSTSVQSTLEIRSSHNESNMLCFQHRVNCENGFTFNNPITQENRWLSRCGLNQRLGIHQDHLFRIKFFKVDEPYDDDEVNLKFSSRKTLRRLWNHLN